MFDESDANTARSAAGRAALESAVWAPTSMLADPEVEWRAENDEVVTAAWPVAPERPEVRLRIDRYGAIKSAGDRTLGQRPTEAFGYIPCGCEVHAERRFGKVLVPSRVTVGWWFGTPRYVPFFRSEITDVTPTA